MPKNLIVIESPAKAKTIKKYVGSDFQIVATVGHLKDLPVSKLGVDLENDFRPEYVTIKGKTKYLKALKAAGKEADVIYLAPDPDREGEAIAWHIADELKNGGKIYRVLFNELTERAIKEAIASPQGLNRDKFESQQARRILDRLVGYQISPLLWTRVKRGLSAGRVQSVALKMICDREREIHAFQAQEYWSLTAHLSSEEPPAFKAKLSRYEGKKIELKDGEQTNRIVSELKGLPFVVERITRREKKKNPPPPFITSLLQQEAYGKLRFPAKKTMFLAQNLYEGIELGSRGQTGLITYMRTDSFRLSEEALSMARDYIGKTYGKDFLPGKPNRFRSRKGAQEAHEAIRPTSVELDPGKVAPFLSKEQLALYSLIWNRFVASQMTPAKLDQTRADIAAGKATFSASGSIVRFKGFTALYEEGGKEDDTEKNQEGHLPPLKEGQILHVARLEPAQHFTQPPPRFTEATLIKALEENGIGRPSTYAAILSNINKREYVSREKGRFSPTELGFLVTDLLVESFPEILNTDFTAQMEDNLDKIERGEAKWNRVLSLFYDSFHRSLKKAEHEMKRQVETDISCPECGQPMAIKSGRNGIFLACTGYPECRHTSNFSRDEKGRIVVERAVEAEATDVVCEACGRPMLLKKGKFGSFLACSGYPECKNTQALEPVSTGVPCPEGGCPGTLVERNSKKGRKFYACNQYPSCRFVTWDEPYDASCPKCGTPVLNIKPKKDSEPLLTCRKRGCGFKTPLSAIGDD